MFPLLKGQLHAAFQFLPGIRLGAAVALFDRNSQNFDFFIGTEPKPAFFAFSAPSNSGPIFNWPRVQDFSISIFTVGTAHKTDYSVNYDVKPTIAAFCLVFVSARSLYAGILHIVAYVLMIHLYVVFVNPLNYGSFRI